MQAVASIWFFGIPEWTIKRFTFLSSKFKKEFELFITYFFLEPEMTTEKEAFLKMKIRRATVNDSFAVCRIANSLRLNQNKPHQNGFLIYVLDQEAYLRKITSSPYFVVAQENNDVIGYAMCYDSATLRKLFAQGELAHEDKIADFLARQKNFIYCDQIGVEFQHERKGVGESLIYKIFQEMTKNKIQSIFAIILHEPLRNEASISFFTKMGFNLKRKIKNTDGRVFGLYEKTQETDEN
jgi:ribosomal protein S18 acetylase RimI-like enzyme